MAKRTPISERLRAYINSFPREDRKGVRQRLAEEVGVSEVLIRSMANGNRPIQPDYVIPLERVTDGFVSRDFYWAESEEHAESA